MGYAVPAPFVVLATANPVEHEGVYRLPEAQLDRFLMRIEVGYPSAVAEREVIANRTEGRTPEQLGAVVTVEEMARMVGVADGVFIAPPLQDYMVAIASATRRLPEGRLGVSPRGTLGLAVASQALAAASGRTFVTPQDVKAVAPNVLAHRMILRPEAQVQGHTAGALVASILSSVPVPQERARA